MDADKQPSQDEQPPVLEYAGPGTRKPWWKMRLLELAVAISIVALVIFVLHPSLGADGEQHNRVKCAAKLRQIGQACLLYANDHQGRFPVSFEQLIQGSRSSSELFLCPSSSDRQAKGSTPAEIVANFAKPGHCSYAYVGSGLSASAPVDTVLAYERLVNHGKRIINVLYADGHVERMDGNEAVGFIAELDAGFNPPRPLNQRPATQPATP